MSRKCHRIGFIDTSAIKDINRAGFRFQRDSTQNVKKNFFNGRPFKVFQCKGSLWPLISFCLGHLDQRYLFLLLAAVPFDKTQTQNTFRIQSSFQIVGWAWSSFYRKKKTKHQCHTAKNKLFGCLGISFQKFRTFCTNNCVNQSQWQFRLASTPSNIKNHNNSNNG